jgi:hypothetical protein
MNGTTCQTVILCVRGGVVLAERARRGTEDALGQTRGPFLDEEYEEVPKESKKKVSPCSLV